MFGYPVYLMLLARNLRAIVRAHDDRYTREEQIDRRNRSNVARWRAWHGLLLNMLDVHGFMPSFPDYRNEEQLRSGAKLVIRRNWVKAGVRPGNTLRA